MQVSNNSTFAGFGLNPFNWTSQDQTTSAGFGPTLSERCGQWATYLDANVSSMVEKSNRFVDVVNQVFAVTPDFFFLHPNVVSRQDFDALRWLLAPGGVVLGAVDRLCLEQNVKFELHLSQLHFLTQQKLKSADASDTFRGNCDSSGSIFRVNAFEYYFYRFTDFVYRNTPMDDCSDVAAECAFSILAQDYLLHFLPVDRSMAPLLDDSVLSHRSNISIMSTSLSTPRQRLNTPFGLLKRDLFETANSIYPPCEQKLNAPSSVFLTKSWSFLQILCDVWLVNAASSRADAYLTLLIRSVVKHVYRFAFRSSPTSSNVAQLRDYKENVVARVLAPKMFKFFEFNYSKWPLDASFRCLLELFLTFIQPWRYAVDDEMSSTVVVDRRYENFFDKNFVFYAKFIKQTFARLIRTDLNSSKNAALAFRVVKVLAQENLVPLLGNVDAARCRNAFDGQRMFDEEFFLVLDNFCAKTSAIVAACDSALEEIRAMQQKETWSAWFINSFTSDENRNAAKIDELKRTFDYLSYSTNVLDSLFNLAQRRRPETGGNFEWANNSAGNRSFSPSSGGGKLRPECRVDESTGALQLTPKGRMEILNKLGSFENFVGFDDEAPTRFDEIGIFLFLVKALSNFINRRYAHKISRLYSESGLVGAVARRVFLPPASESWKSSPTPNRRRIYIPARLSLRRLASLRFILTFFVCLFFMWLIFSVSPFFVLFLCWFVFLLLLAVLEFV